MSQHENSAVGQVPVPYPSRSAYIGQLAVRIRFPYAAVVDGFAVDVVPADAATRPAPVEAMGPDCLFGRAAREVHVVPGWNAYGRRATREENDRTLEALFAEVRDGTAFEAVTYALDRSWVERAVVLCDVPVAEVRELAEHHGQHRVLRWDASGLRSVTFVPGEPESYDSAVPVTWQGVTAGCPMRLRDSDRACVPDEQGPVWEAHRGMLAETLGCRLCDDRPADDDVRRLLVPTRERPWDRTPQRRGTPAPARRVELHPTPTEADVLPYGIIEGSPVSPVVVHAPHADRRIPPWVRARIRLSESDLDRELTAMTDRGTEIIAVGGATAATLPAWGFVNALSRLVVDPERFTDPGLEEMDAVGMGAVYTATSDLRVLRDPDPAHRAQLLERYFHPYADALADLVDERLAAAGRALLIDVHSYPTLALPYERHPELARPQVCIGTDPDHTPGWLLDAALAAFASWELAVDEPFQGSYVPQRHYRTDLRVASVMVEIRRDVYLEPGGGLLDTAFSRLMEAVGRLAAATP